MHKNLKLYSKNNVTFLKIDDLLSSEYRGFINFISGKCRPFSNNNLIYFRDFQNWELING